MSVNQSKTCPMCLVVKEPNEFYRRRKNKSLSVYCKLCSNLQTTRRQRKFKEQCISYKGGKCERCGYSSCNSALEFHHLDPKHKDFAISHARLTAFSTKVIEELDKCIMLCANCHREIHSK